MHLVFDTILIVVRLEELVVEHVEDCEAALRILVQQVLHEVLHSR